ncbi:hypothetical protein FGIG_08791 [Fasciola gigantica]|uniref:Trematode PH-like domain-containing protein n=1 Tax=Fasciola gigantica TaxID=46835 RepID=A0A504YHK1_FASGI|nr:hypothetical protein FGIG_08791 [Fasciola gigantica]
MPFRRHHSSGPGSLSSRSFSTPSMYDGSVLDRKTRQPLFFECHVCILGRHKLSADENFSLQKAEVVMNHLHKKRQSHCKLYCLEDRLRFAKSKVMSAQPMRNFVTYKAIKHIFIFREKPDVFMLCVDSGLANKRTYEAYKCKMKEDVLTLCEMAFKASKDPEFKLRNSVPLRDFIQNPELDASTNQFSTNEMSGPASGAQSTSSIAEMQAPNLGVQSVFDLYERQKRPENAVINPNDQVTTALEEPPPSTHSQFVHEHPRREMPDHSTLTIINDQTELFVPSDIDEILNVQDKLTRQLDDNWEVTITFLQWDNVRGATVNDRGPIYMYVARCLHPVAE